MKRENKFQSELIKEIKKRIPGSFILKNDPNYIQGVPDLTVFYPGGRVAILECKRSEAETKSPRPNQGYYIQMFTDMGFYASFIYPENKEEILNALERTL